MAFAVTHDFTADTTAVASQANQNFTDIETELNAFPTDGALADGAVSTTAKLANNIITTAKMNSAAFKDEDDMASDLATAVASQQSIKKYVDDRVGKTYRYLPVNGSNTKVYTKYLTGTLDADDTTLIAHGVTDFDDILSVTATVYHSSTTQYRVFEYYGIAAAAGAYYLNYDATYIRIASTGSELQSGKYRIRIDYK